MSSGHKTFTLFIAVIGELLVAIAGLALGWQPLWLWPVLALSLLAGAVAAFAAADRRKPLIPREALPDPDLPIPPRESQERYVTEVALPSQSADYDFLFSASIRWAVLEDAGYGPPVSPGGLAVSAILERARAVTAQQLPLRCSLIQHQLGGALGTMQADGSGRVLAMADNISLTLSEPDRDRLSKLSTVRKDEAVWEHERKYERNKRTYLGEDVLKDPGSAVVWYLSRNEDAIEHTVDLIGTLTRLAGAANTHDFPDPVDEPDSPPSVDEHRPHPAWEDSASGPGDGQPAPEDPTVEYVGLLLEHLGVPDTPEGAVLAQRFAENIAKCSAAGAAEAAAAVRDHFTPPAPPPYQDAAQEESGPAPESTGSRQPPPQEPPLPDSQD
ncbi:hypothetical protein A6A06_28865 [Streptomyces sp. CB02923]|uniref:hypothetical protein n=1 Tax=Streptomyces sp. CB02923 TaxID=1718985 RepID=UPI00093CD0CD|nr:hypothetical protein [Streptomyces sp. CB02923]OKH98214.1 hypothetical protein A6A06_28865 [Streptomyces sp. CB02923]